MSEWNYWWADGGQAAQPRYRQFQHNGFSVGCGAVAWALLIGWADRQADDGNPRWSKRWGLYRQNGGTGADARAPIAMNEGIRNVIREISDHIGTFKPPLSSQGAVWPNKMSRVYEYLRIRTGTGYRTRSRAYFSRSIRRMVSDEIRSRQSPAVVGIGVLRHYALAYGYAEETQIVRILGKPIGEKVVSRHFCVNQGHGSNLGEWISTRAWFGGCLIP